MKNEYEIRGDVTAIIIKSPKYGVMETLISTTKLERAQEHCANWYVGYSTITESFYVRGYTRLNGKQKNIFLHRWITDAPEGTQVDHINHKTMDNTDHNLRVITKDENNQNRSGAQRNSASGIRGVYWDKSRNRWRASARVNKQRIHIGWFKQIEDARFAVAEWRKNYMPYSQEALS